MCYSQLGMEYGKIGGKYPGRRWMRLTRPVEGLCGANFRDDVFLPGATFTTSSRATEYASGEKSTGMRWRWIRQNQVARDALARLGQ